MSFLKELFNSMARVIGRIIAYLLIGFLLFYIFNNKVDAASYYFDAPRVHNFCATDIYGYCNTFSRADTKYLDPGYGVGNYYNAIYRADTNINNITGNTFVAGNYSVSFSGSIRIIEDTNLNTNLFKLRLIYYPTSSNEYGIATCDNNESFTIEKDNLQPRLYWYSYSCETLQITEGKTFLGWNIYLDLPSTNLVKYFEFAGITTNLTLIGEGEATNNDIINNQNQNTQDIINNQNQNQQQTNQGLQDIEDALLDTTQPNLDNFNYTDSTGGLISTFLTMPITLLRVMNNVESCRVITLGELFGTPLRLDCINPGVFLGETLWNIIDYFIVFTMITSIAQLFIYVYEKFKNLDDFFNEFYTPQHMKPDEYIPRHGGGK